VSDAASFSWGAGIGNLPDGLFQVFVDVPIQVYGAVLLQVNDAVSGQVVTASLKYNNYMSIS
jgi:hypothetical protein